MTAVMGSGWVQDPPQLLRQSTAAARTRQQQQQQRERQAGAPGLVRGPGAPADALWVEHRRSAAEQQQHRLQRRRQQQFKAKPRLQTKHSLQGVGWLG